MREEIKKLKDDWSKFNIGLSDKGYYDCDEKDVQQYQSLMVRTFKILKDEWKQDTVNKDLALLMMEVARLTVFADYDGNVQGSEEYERIALFNDLFVDSLSEDFRYNEDGKLLFKNPMGVGDFAVDTETFKIPSFDDLFELGNEDFSI